MIRWIVSAVLVIAGGMASWWVAPNELIYPVVQMIIGTLLIVMILCVLAFWRPGGIVNWLRSSRSKTRRL